MTQHPATLHFILNTDLSNGIFGGYVYLVDKHVFACHSEWHMLHSYVKYQWVKVHLLWKQENNPVFQRLFPLPLSAARCHLATLTAGCDQDRDRRNGARDFNWTDEAHPASAGGKTAHWPYTGSTLKKQFRWWHSSSPGRLNYFGVETCHRQKHTGGYFSWKQLKKVFGSNEKEQTRYIYIYEIHLSIYFPTRVSSRGSRACRSLSQLSLGL